MDGPPSFTGMTRPAVSFVSNIPVSLQQKPPSYVDFDPRAKKSIVQSGQAAVIPSTGRQTSSMASSSSSSFQEFAHLQFPLHDILSATNNFADENLVGYGGFGKVYRGQLLRDGKSISIVAKRLDRVHGQGDIQFRTEISMLSRVRHRNIVSIVGFCDEDGEKILIIKYEVNGSLDKYLTSPTQLTWGRRLRICVDVARALSYLHHDTKQGFCVIHGDIKSYNILLDENWEAKVCDFGLSIGNLATRRHRLVISLVKGTTGYVDPVFQETSTLTQKSDVYSFGVLLFEVLYGREANIIRDDGESQFLATLAKEHYKDGKIGEMIDPQLRNQMDPQSFTIFSETAYHCLDRLRSQRPSMEIVVKRLERALELQEKHENPENKLKISLEDMKLATQNFSDNNCIRIGSNGKVYKGEIVDANGHKINIDAKRLDTSLGSEFLTELEVFFEYKHENVIGLVGYCDEMGENIIVYEYASRGSLDKCMNDDRLRWMQRIQICIDIASGLDFLHGTSDLKREAVIHRDIKSSNILLTGDWKAKITDFGLSLICPIYQEIDYAFVYPAGTPGYADPLYEETGVLTKESDIYSFGVVLLEMLCGRFAMEHQYSDNPRYLSRLVKQELDKGRIEEMVFEGIKKQIVPESLAAYCKIACQCLQYEREARPTAREVILQLEKALEIQGSLEQLRDQAQQSLDLDVPPIDEVSLREQSVRVQRKDHPFGFETSQNPHYAITEEFNGSGRSSSSEISELREKMAKIEEDSREAKLREQRYLAELEVERKHRANLEAEQARHVAQLAEQISLSQTFSAFLQQQGFTFPPRPPSPPPS